MEQNRDHTLVHLNILRLQLSFGSSVVTDLICSLYAKTLKNSPPLSTEFSMKMQIGPMDDTKQFHA